VRRCERLDCVERKPLERQPANSAATGQLSEQVAKRMCRLELVVPVGDNDQRGHRVEAAREQLEHVERRLVGPVEVLENENRTRPAQFVAQRRRNIVRVRSGPRIAGDKVEQWPQRARSEERLAHSPKNSALRLLGIAEPAHKRRLADSRLAVDEHEAAVPAGRFGERLVKRIEARFALE
jgi:hypothetical protein